MFTVGGATLTVGGAAFTVGGDQFTVGGALFTVGGATQNRLRTSLAQEMKKKSPWFDISPKKLIIIFIDAGSGSCYFFMPLQLLTKLSLAKYFFPTNN